MIEEIPPNSIEHLYGPEDVPYEEDELVLVCLMRNGRPYVNSFVEHHTSLGIKHMFFLDNGSTDGTVDALKQYENVSVLHTRLPFKRYQVSMRQYLIERFGKKGRWCLYADIDELFDYPYSDVVGLHSLLGYLNERSYTAVVAQMLDMFPEEPLSDRAGNRLDEPLMERHRFYDISNIRRQYYSSTNVDARDHYAYRYGFLDISDIRAQGSSATKVHNAQDHWAFRRACGTGNVLENEDIEVYRGGIQNTILGGSPPLTKHPLVFLDEKIKPMDRSAHSVSDARIADFTCVLFHYKFLNYLYELIRQAAHQDRYGNKRYEKWLGVLKKTPTLQVKGETARELRSVNDLVENHFLVVSEDYMMLVYEQEEEHKKGGGNAPRRDGQGGGPGDEAAFRRARARAKVQGLRARRLERRLEDLREHNQRQLQKLRSQYQRRIERLNRRLARTKKKTKKKNRALTNQLRSIRASRSRRLLNKLARLRAKVLRKNATKQGAPQ